MKCKQLMLSAVLIAALAGCKSQKRVLVVPPQASADIPYFAVRPEIKADDKSFMPDAKIGASLVKEAREWLGTPYLYGGETRSGADCSGFLMTVFKNVCGLSLPRNSAAQREYCVEIDKSRLSPGDLVFFTSSAGKGKVSHVGMYVGDGRIIHASTSRGVVESALQEKYYVTHYHSSGRVYAITYAATGGKIKSPKSAPESKEISLDDFVAASSKKAKADTAIVVETVVNRTVEVIDSASATVDSLRAIRPELPDSLPGPKVIINGRRVEVRAESVAPTAKSDTTAVDTTRKAEIRDSVRKAMNFGK